MVEFTQGTTKRSGAESVPDLVFQLAAAYVPANNEGQLDYQITGGADAARFELINDAQGEDNWAHLVLVGENWSDDLVDYETKLDADGDGKYVVDVTVTSTLNGAQTTGTFFITVNDVTIDYWMQAALSYSTDVAVTEVFNASIEEGAANGTQLFEAFSTDGSDSPVYSLIADSSNGAFEIDAVTGIVSVKNGSLIDFETMGSAYVITVKATESSTDFVTQDFNIGNGFITITDVASEPGETITGTNGTDKITPLTTVSGQPFPTAKDDKIDGGKGSDHIDGWLGSDRLNGGLGIDTVGYASSSASVTVDLQQQGTSSATGAPTADGSAQSGGAAQGDLLWGFENILGSAKNDTLTGDQFANLIEGGDGDDVLDGGAGIDTLRGDAGNDKIAGNAGNDTFDGGTGIDALDYTYLAAGQNLSLVLGALDKSGNAAQLTAKVKSGAVTLETDTVKGFENVTGGAGNDKLTGNAGDNWLTGGAGADILIGGAGADRLHGNVATSVDLGNPGDTADYSASNAGVTLTINNVSYSGPGKGGHAEGDILAGINNIIGSNFNDFLSGDTGFNTTPGGVLNGGGGDDIIRAATNSSGTNILDGGTNGAAGDTIDYSWASNIVALTIALSNTKDALTSVTSLNLLPTSIKNFENVIGGAGDDTITGSDGANVIEGGAGADQLVGDLGIDTVSYAASLDGVTVWLFDKQGQSNADGSKSGPAFDEQEGGDAQGDELWGFENIVGSANNDFVVGNDGVNVLKGGAGADKIAGVKGDDMLHGEGGDDVFDAGGDEMGAGKDTMDGGVDLDIVDYTAETVAVIVTLGKDGASATAAGDKGSNAIGDKLINIEGVTGGSGNDKLTGNNLANVLSGGAGNDLLIGGAGADILDGANGFDTISYAASAAGVTVNLAALGTYVGGNPTQGRDDAGAIQTGGDAQGDTIWSIESIIGSAKNDRFTTDSSTQLIDGGKGDDVFAPANGGLVLLGGDGLDTLSFAGVFGGVDINLTIQGKANAARNAVTGGLNNKGEALLGSSVAEFENLIGGSGGDDLVGDTKANIIDGGLGVDTLDGGAGTDTVSFATLSAGVVFSLGALNTKTGEVAATDATSVDVDLVMNFENIVGSAHSDTLSGNGGVNVIDGGEGSDELRGFEGTDTLRGGADKDVFYAGGTSGIGADTYDGGAGFDTLTYLDESLGVTVVLGANGASANVTGGPNAAGDKLISIESVIGGNGNDKFTGNNLAHQLDGGAGNDTLTGGTGDSTVYGQQGNDTIVASIGTQEIYQGGDDTDTLSFANFAANTVVNVNLATNTHSVTGISSLSVDSFEILIGGKGNDTLTGNAAAATTIQGGAGNDKIQGGVGIDTFTGGAGNDTFVFVDANQGKDVFTDFANLDKLQIDKAAFAGGLELLASGALTDTSYLVVGAGAVATNTGGHGQFVYNTTTDILSWDVDGDGGAAAIEIGQFNSNVTLKLADFALV